MSCIDTLFGHQNGVTGIDTLYRDRCISVGGRDHKACIFKIPEQTFLTYETNKDNNNTLDLVKLFNESTFLTASAEGGAISLWTADKRKAKFTSSQAHGQNDNWISSLATTKNGDVFASGSNNGKVNLYKVSFDSSSFQKFKNDSKKLMYSKFSILKEIEVPGFVNCLEFDESGQFLFLGVGQEHRLGRWWRDAKTRNSLYVFKLF